MGIKNRRERGGENKNLPVRENDILKAFKRHLCLKNITSYDRYCKDVRDFLEYLSSLEIEFTTIKPHILDDYRAYILTRKIGFARGTVNNRLTQIKCFYRFLLKKQIIHYNPFTFYKGLKRGKIIPKNILSIENMGKLIDNFSIRTDLDVMMYSMVELLYGSSLRIGEVSKIKIEDINFNTGYVYITNFKNKNERLRFPLSEVSMNAVKRYMKYIRDKIITEQDNKEGWLYPQQGKTTHRGLLNRKLKNECKRLGLKKISSHCFRHSSATHMLKKGAGIREVQAMLGHKRLSSTQMYTRLVKDDLKKVVRTFHPREQEVQTNDAK